MANENSKVSIMEKESKVPDIPIIESKEEIVEDLSGEQTSGALQTIATKIKETVNLDLFLPQIHGWIDEKLKKGPTLIIGERIGEFALKISDKLPSVIARETTSTFVSAEAEVKDSTKLNKIDLKPFDINKLAEIQDVFINIIIIFALRKLEREQQKQLLRDCKKMLSRDGQLVVVGEFYPRSLFLMPISGIKEMVRTFKTTVLKKKIAKPITKIDKLANELELKFFDVKYDAGGRVRTYVLTKRWGALVS